MRRPPLAPGALFLAVALGACGETPSSPRPEPVPAPRWIDLARGFRPPPLEELARDLEARVEPARPVRYVRPAERPEELWFELPLPRESWTRTEAAGTWQAVLPRGGALLAGESVSQVLVDPEHPLVFGKPRREKSGRYWIEGPRICLTTARDGEPSDRLTFRMRLDHGHEQDGHWRVAQADLACNGFLLFPGVPVRIPVDVPAASELHFATVSPDPAGLGEHLGPTTFRVTLDGAPLLEHVQELRRPVRSTGHRVALATSGRHELEFTIEGSAPALIADPLLVPREIGTPGARPWGAVHPDLVLVLCDTFRADNLEAWGGKPDLAPKLNAFVERSLRFLDSRSVAAWTLPSIATILSGVYPGQHGATDLDRGVASEVETIAERLASQGYRTAAVTDGGLFSRHYGQDQGFEWFEEVPVTSWNLNDTLERARTRMAADDGRPLFLVVHTYRVHGPMRVGPDESFSALQALRAAITRRLEERRARGETLGRVEAALDFVDEGRRIYDDAVQDLDRKLGAWLEELERAGFLARGRVLLTADHGNSHGEHGQMGHGGDLYDVKLRVPLAIAGRGITPRAVSGPVSLIDVAPTLADLAEVAPAPSWKGRSLLERVPAGPIYAFELKPKERQVALYAEGKKLMAPDIEALQAGHPSFAFDLARDPAEDDNQAGASDADWAAELGRRLAAALEPLVVPPAGVTALQLPPDVMKSLRDIGYGGDTEALEDEE